MCMQCMATAMTAGAGVSGTRAYIAAKHFSWVTPRRMRAITATLLAAGLVASSHPRQQLRHAASRARASPTAGTAPLSESTGGRAPG